MQHAQSLTLKSVTLSWGQALMAGVTAVLLAAATFTGVSAAPNDLQCFSGTTDGGFNGTCEITGTSAVLNTVDNDNDPNNAYAGVYYENSILSGQLIGDVDALSFEYNGSGAAGGSPRITLPIDHDGDGMTDTYVSMDTTGCTDGTANVGTVDVINDDTCVVAENVGGATYPNWAAYVAAHPEYRVTEGGIPFVIVDQPGLFTVSNVVIGESAEPQPVVVTSKDECKKNGWMSVVRADGTSFKNQGDCVSYVASKGKAKGNPSPVELLVIRVRGLFN